jgi:hypothetical protein
MEVTLPFLVLPRQSAEVEGVLGSLIRLSLVVLAAALGIVRPLLVLRDRVLEVVKVERPALTDIQLVVVVVLEELVKTGPQQNPEMVGLGSLAQLRGPKFTMLAVEVAVFMVVQAMLLQDRVVLVAAEMV